MGLRLTSGHAALIDLVDEERLSGYVWYPLYSSSTMYAQTMIRVSGRRVSWLLHRAVMSAPSWLDVDHVNHDGLDCRRVNLRMATESQNGGNSRISRNNTSGYKGVTRNKRDNNWCAQITIDRKRRYLGYFADPWEAAQAYSKAALAQWGEFALLNERKPR